MSRSRSFDIVVPVYNAMVHARACIESILRFATVPYRLYIVNDGSDEYTSSELSKFATNNDNVTLITNSENKGYLRSVNIGIDRGSGDFVVLVNSDALFFAGVLERLEAIFETDRRIGVVGAVSTWANWTRIPFPAGTNMNEIASLVSSQRNDGSVSDIGNASGFFFATPRRVYNELGLFDEIYSPGYWEEADFCMRVLSQGYRVVVDRSLYVFHHGWGSFLKDARDENMSKNRDKFLDRWRDQYAPLEAQWRKNNPIDGLCRALELGPRLHGAQADIFFILDANTNLLEIISIFHCINELVRGGLNVNAIVIGQVAETALRNTPMYFRPIFVDDPEDCSEGFEANVAIAVGRKALFFALRLQSIAPRMAVVHGDRRSAFSSDFAATSQRHWEDGISALCGSEFSSPLAVNTDVFYPTKDSRTCLIVVFSLFESMEEIALIRGLSERLRNIRPDIQIEVLTTNENAVFDDGLSFQILKSEMDFAKALRRAQAMLLLSKEEGAAQSGLSAMAGGVPLIAHIAGCCAGFARHLGNSVLFDSMSVTDISNAIAQIVDDENLCIRLRAKARETGLNYSQYVAAEKYLSILSGIENVQ